LKESWLPKLSCTSSKKTTQGTSSPGTFWIKYKAQAQIIFSELHETRTITCEAHIAPELGSYEITTVREKLKELDIKLKFEDETIEWDAVIILMGQEGCKIEKQFQSYDSAHVDEATKHINRILDAKNEPA
jgi:hypothetical protein